MVRSIDIANDMNYSKPSISVAMKNLRLNGYINVDNSGFITLTDSGMEIASNIYDRHLILRKWLEFLGIASGDGRTGCVQDRAYAEQGDVCSTA